MNEPSTQKGKPKYEIVQPDTRPIMRPMSAAESSVLQQYAANPVIMVEQAFQSQEGADERTSGIDRSYAFLLRLAPLVALWAILSVVVAGVLVMVIEADETTSAMIGLVIFVLLCFQSYSAADTRERYDSKNGVEHHRIDTAESLTLKKMEHDQVLKRMALEATLKQLEARGNDY